ncbi:MAG TPA: hypothetical protein VHO90_22565, partial [Bacteroidales bacterium]|nr:hypothetical protein [Bacteroidales bacterium]
ALKGKSEQLEHIVNFVKANYSWNGNLGKYASKSLKEFQKEKTGNGANINLFLAGLLRGAGFEAFPVLISTRGNGTVYKDYPFLHFFNNVIVLVKVGEKFVFTDATDSYCAYDHIPSRCLNGLGLIVKKEGEGWAALVNPEISKIEESLFVDFNPGLDSVNLNVQKRFSNYEAYDYKVAYKNDIAEITKSLNKKDYYIADSVVTQNYDNPKEKYFLKYKAKVPFDMVGNKIYISPFLNEPIDENPLKQTERTYPVDFIYPFGRTYISEITIPQGFKPEFLPDPLKINNAMASVNYSIIDAGGKLVITGLYTFKKAVYEPEEYKDLKFIYNEIIKKFNEKIAFVKI